MAENSETPKESDSDVFFQYENLSPRQKQALAAQKPGCDYQGVDEFGNKATCNHEGTHAVFGLRYETNSLGDRNLGIPPFDESYEQDYRVAGNQNDVRIYCPHHADQEKDKLQAAIGKQNAPTSQGDLTVTEAAKMPVQNVVGAHNREYTTLFKHLGRGLALNYLRHSGLDKTELTPISQPSKTSDEDEMDLFVRNIFGEDEDTYEKGADQAPHSTYIVPKSETAMNVAAKQYVELPKEKKQLEAENKRVRTRLSKARSKGEYWCTDCQKSTKQNSNSCDDCGKQPILSTEVKSRPVGRPIIGGEDEKVEAATYDVRKSWEGIFGNKLVTTDPKTKEKRTLPSTVDNITDFVAGKGFLPTKEVNIPIYHEKSKFAETHFAPMENYENTEGIVPKILEPKSDKSNVDPYSGVETPQSAVVQYYSRGGGSSIVFSGPDENTGPSIEESSKRKNRITTDVEGNILPLMFRTASGNTQDFDSEGTSTVGLEDNRSIKSRKREYALNVKMGVGVAPSTTCHECSLNEEKNPKIIKSIKDANGISQGVCGKGHYTRQEDIPIALHEGKVVHVYPRPIARHTKAGRVYSWIPTDEPAIFNSGTPVDEASVNKMSPFRHYQSLLSRRSERDQNLNLIRKVSGMRSSTEDTVKNKMIETNKKRFSDFLQLGMYDGHGFVATEKDEPEEEENVFHV